MADGTANYAEVYYEPVRKLTTAYQLVEADDILGYAVAHELGHLLLGPRHTTHGIMSVRWSIRDLQMMTQRRLRFTQAEGSAMQRKIQQECSAKPQPSNVSCSVGFLRLETCGFSFFL